IDAPFMIALKRAKRRARGLMSIAVTCSACLAASSAWWPLPVPRSSARSTGSRTVSQASTRAGGETPSTWSAVASSFWKASQARTIVDRPLARAASPPRHPVLRQAVDDPRQRLLRLGGGPLDVEQEELDQRREPPAALEHAQIEREPRRITARRDLRRERLAH